MSIASPNLPRTGGSVAAPDTTAISGVADAAVSPLAPVRRANAMQLWVSALLGRPTFWALFVLVAFSWPLVRVVRTVLPPKLPVLATISAFELVDQTGRPFGDTQLDGRVWVLCAIRTSSPAAADLATELGKIQHRARNLGPAFHIVTVDADADGDAPARLADFTARYRVSPRIWRFLSGDPPALRRAETALGLDLGSALATPSDRSEGPLSVTLVDGKMRVRGHYDLADPNAIDTLLYHLGLLVNRGD